MKQANTPVAQTITESTYMDNIITGFDSTNDLFGYFEEAKRLFSDISMNLHQWYSNNTQFMYALPPDEKGSRDKPSVLGLKWDLAKDSLACTAGTLAKAPPSKRSVLQGIATVFDPCGWFSPVTVAGKILMQSLWKAKLDWDEKLSSDFTQEWEAVRLSLVSVPDHTVARRYSWQGLNARDGQFELHVFSDASGKAYSACVYLRAKFGKSVFCDLLFAKTRVAPLKPQTIPKLELTAVRVGTRLLAFVEKQIRLPITSKTLWTDSLCVLCWIESDKVSTTFVQNRVREIRAAVDLQFRHVPSRDNPADLGSRGTTYDTLANSSLWWHGPNWLLSDESTWPQRPQGHPITPLPHAEEVQLLSLADQVVDEDLFQLDRFSSLNKLLRVTAYVQRALLKFKGKQSPSGTISAKEIEDSLSFWEKRIQEQHFAPMWQQDKSYPWKNFIRTLGLYLDDKGFIRSRGRFQFSDSLPEKAKFPLLLPKRSKFTKLVITDCHNKVMHFRVKHTMAKIRERYWVPQGRSVVKNTLLKCQICRIHRGAPFRMPETAPLPSFRASIKRPFAASGLDYLGPLYVRDGTDSCKVWVAHFTCAVTRAVHLEVVNSLSASDFLMALRRFVALYSKPQIIVSDNVRQFKAADQLLKKEFKRLAEEDSVTEYLAAAGIEWKYIVEKAPWMGGFYERLVSTVKEALKKSLGIWTVKAIELQTICYEAAFVINSRPMIYAEDDPGAHVLTPLDLLFRSTECFPDGSGEEVINDQLSKADELLMHWKAGQNLLRQFWDSWKNHYLVGLREFSRYPDQRGASEIPVAEGVVVLIKDNLPRGQWKVGKIVKLRKSTDGVVRAAELKLGSVLVRPVKLLYPIEGGTGTPDTSTKQTSTVNNMQNQTTELPITHNRPKRKAADTARDLTKQILAGL